MLFPAIDMETKQVKDIMLGGDAAHLYRELIEFYNMVTGERRTGFNSLDEAKKMCVEAAQRRYFGGEVPVKPRTWVPPQVPTAPAQPTTTSTAAPPPHKPVPPWAQGAVAPVAAPAQPAPAQVTRSEPEHDSREVHAEGPVARARRVFEEMSGAPRKDILDACVKLGIKRSTAQTQYQAWKKAREEAIEKGPDGVIRLPPGSYVGNASTH